MDTKHEIISFEEFVAGVSDVFEQVAVGKRVTIERDGILFSVRASRVQPQAASRETAKPRAGRPSAGNHRVGRDHRCVWAD